MELKRRVAHGVWGFPDNKGRRQRGEPIAMIENIKEVVFQSKFLSIMPDIANFSSQLASTPATEMFQKHWALYQKILVENYMNHRELYDRLHEFWLGNFPEPFKLLELGCGDASFSARALSGTAIASYQGVDLSEVALEIARDRLAGVDCPSSFIRGNFIEVVPELVSSRPGSFDGILISFALHHLSFEEKDRLIGQLFQLLKEGGVFILIDIILKEGETRSDYLKRYLERAKENWSSIASEEFLLLEEHITQNDFPETQEALRFLSQKHGFQFECLWVSPHYTEHISGFYKSRG